MASQMTFRSRGFLYLVGFAIASWMPTMLLACDADEALPGAIPPAPHGGFIAEAKSLAKTEKSEATEEKENALYWEAVYDKQHGRIYLHLISMVPPKTAVFSTIPIAREFTDLRIKIEMPRENRSQAVNFHPENDGLVVDFDSKELNRFIVHVSGQHKNQARTAQIQIEEE